MGTSYFQTVSLIGATSEFLTFLFIYTYVFYKDDM